MTSKDPAAEISELSSTLDSVAAVLNPDAMSKEADRLREEAGDPYDGVTLRFVNPATGAAVFPTLGYSAGLLRPGEATRWKRETANSFTIVLDGAGTTEIAGQRFDWETNDFFMVPSFLWRRHTNRGPRDAVLYLCSDRPLFEKIGQYRAQGRTPEGGVVQLVA